MKDVTTYIGIDAHKKDLFVSMLVGDQRTPPVSWKVANEPQAVRRLVKKLEREAPGQVRVFYEAGPCGYALQRQLTTPRMSCDVIAPALMPRKPGERVKTNRRDGCKLVELGRAGLLTAVHQRRKPGVAAQGRPSRARPSVWPSSRIVLRTQAIRQCDHRRLVDERLTVPRQLLELLNLPKGRFAWGRRGGSTWHAHESPAGNRRRDGPSSSLVRLFPVGPNHDVAIAPACARLGA